MSEKYGTDKLTVYRNVRLTKDAKHFPKKDDLGAATYLTFVDQTKGGEDIFIDAKVRRGADLMAALKKGDLVDVTGSVDFSINAYNGKLVGKIHEASVATQVRLRDRTAEGPAAEAPATEAAAPAFD